MTAYQILIALFLILFGLKVFETAWILRNNRRFQRILNQLDQDNQEVMEWFEKLKAGQREDEKTPQAEPSVPPQRLTLKERVEEAKRMIDQYQKNGSMEDVVFWPGNWLEYPRYAVRLQGKVLRFHVKLQYIIFDGEDQ